MAHGALVSASESKPGSGRFLARWGLAEALVVASVRRLVAVLLPATDESEAVGIHPTDHAKCQ